MERADVVVVGGGTVGAWTACFLAEAGRSVVLVEADTLGSGASSRASGMVRAQGGTEVAIRLGMFSREFYAGQRDRYPLDSGFVAQGYLMPCFTEAEVAAAHDRIALQRSLGLDVEWLDSDAIDRRATGLAPGVTLGASYAASDGYLDAPRNVLAYTAALVALGVDVREHRAFTGLRVDGGRAAGVDTSDGPIQAEAVVLTGGPDLAAVGTAAGGRIFAGGTRHQVVVTAPLPGVDPHTLPMVFDVTSGIYWRPGEEGGLLWGMSNPDEPPGRAREFDWGYYERMRERVATLLPATAGLGLRRAWAATIDYTPDHLPIIGPLVRDDGPVAGTVVASAGGHGMMWGPGVARATADVVLHGTTDLVDLTDLGLERFDADGRSRLAADPIALPFPQTLTETGTHQMTTPHRTPHISSALHTELEDWGPLEEATGPEMATAGIELWVDGEASGGIWECTPGPSHWTLETHEVIHLVAGRMTVTPDDGEPTEIGAGDMAVFPKGWSGSWDIHETVRKVYAIF